MSVADKGTYLSRFTIKLVEMVAAGIATAVSGYLVAHLGGYLFSATPAPATVQVAPASGGTSKAASTSPRVRAVSADAGEKHHAPAQDASSPVTQTVRTAVTTASPAAHKPVTTDTSAAASKAGDDDSVEARVRAALANVDASRPAPVPSDASPHQADLPPAPVAVAVPTPPADKPEGASAVAVTPRAADLASQPLQQATVEPDPLAAVEVKSRPVAAVEPLPASQPSPPAQETAQGEDNGLLSALKKIPDFLRADSSAADGDPPRPPRPVGN